MRIWQFGALFRRDLINLVASPALLLYNTLFPLLLVLALGYLTSGSYGGTVSSYDFYGVTLLVMGSLNVCTTSANSFMERSLKASNLRVLYAPVPPAFIYVSKIAATFVFTSACFAVLAVLLHALLGVNFGGERSGYLAIVLLLFNLFSAALGVLVCCVLHSEETTNKILSPFAALLALAGGLFFPLDGLGQAVATLSWLSPVKWVAESVFRVIYDGDPGLVLPVALVLILATVAALVGCKLTFRTEDYV